MYTGDEDADLYVLPTPNHGGDKERCTTRHSSQYGLCTGYLACRARRVKLLHPGIYGIDRQRNGSSITAHRGCGSNRAARVLASARQATPRTPRGSCPARPINEPDTGLAIARNTPARTATDRTASMLAPWKLVGVLAGFPTQPARDTSQNMGCSKPHCTGVSTCRVL